VLIEWLASLGGERLEVDEIVGRVVDRGKRGDMRI
jgi:hypothetical protein